MEWTDDNGATWSSARITPMENAPRWESIIIVPERELLKRDGVIGKMLDWFFPRYKYNASPGFIAISSDGQHIVTSPDGKTWTMQTTPTTDEPIWQMAHKGKIHACDVSGCAVCDSTHGL